MNDRHPPGTATPPASASDAATALYASYGGQEASYGDFTTYDGYAASGFDTGASASADMATGTYATTSFETDPLFGNMPGDGTGPYDATQWSTGSHQTLNYDPYAAQHQAAYDTGSYETTTWAAGYQQLADIPAQHPGPEASGQWDATAWLQPEQPLDQSQQWNVPAQDTGAYDATQWNSAGGHDPYETYEHQQTGAYEQQHPPAEAYEHQPEPFDRQATATFEQFPYEQPATRDGEFEDTTDTTDTTHTADTAHTAEYADADAPDNANHPDDAHEPLLLDDMEEVVPAPRAASRSASRSRRRSPAKRSALLTVAVPSACVMGVAGIAAASVGSGSGDDDKDTTASAPDAAPVKPSAANNKLDTQLESLSAGADDFADRASRTQERIDLKAQQAAEQKKAAEEAARKERLRPKFALPVGPHGLSAYYGQAGINWMSAHTGIDFPVSYGTTVMSATDGTVRTQWNPAYGNMAIVTAMDGTETWYCHLASYQVPSGTTVKAGDAIALSGNSGNSTGPHLHFEVRPAGGSAIDPLSWLRSHGLDPT
ncbi:MULTISPECIES: M23 family metallopeptidase [Streptomyces]|uniref:M23 family metallopeptidase n=1 Tax=Streptomyces TaxID=1883 RepID=UPI000C42315E|nr:MULTISPECIES: M23 family metallopeptidase [Streptomyces]PIB09125.1 peptidase M23 [Streptomyces sp. HG99]